MNLVPYVRALQNKGARITIATTLQSVRRDGNRLVATLGSPYEEDYSEERAVDQVVVEHATAPLDDLYKALKPLSRNLGAVDYRALVQGGACFPQKAPDAAFDLIRIGDAVASRNIHAAIYDGLRFTLRI